MVEWVWLPVPENFLGRLATMHEKQRLSTLNRLKRGEVEEKLKTREGGR